MTKSHFVLRCRRFYRGWYFLFYLIVFPHWGHFSARTFIETKPPLERSVCISLYIVSRQTDREAEQWVTFSHLGFQRVKTYGGVQKILDGKDKVPAAGRLRATASKSKAGQMPGFQRSCKDQPKTNSLRSQFRCQQILQREHWECFVPACLPQTYSRGTGRGNTNLVTKYSSCISRNICEVYIKVNYFVTWGKKS